MREILPRATALMALGIALYIVFVGVNPYVTGYMIGMMVVVLMRVIDLELKLRQDEKKIEKIEELEEQ